MRSGLQREDAAPEVPDGTRRITPDYGNPQGSAGEFSALCGKFPNRFRVPGCPVPRWVPGFQFQVSVPGSELIHDSLPDTFPAPPSPRTPELPSPRAPEP